MADDNYLPDSVPSRNEVRKVMVKKKRVSRPNNNRNSNSNRDANKPHVLDKGVDIHINVRKIMRGTVLVILLLAVFMAGRWSVDVPGMDSVTGLAVFAADEKVDDLPIEEEVEEPEVEEEVIEEAPEPEVEEEPEEEEYSVITEYNNVELVVNELNIDWKETWGKISQISYTIINDEDGVIQPDYLILTLPAYEDFEKKVPLPLSAKELAPGETYSNTINVPGGFAYNEITVGSLTSVPATVVLKDAEGQAIDSHSGSYNLQG